MVSSGTNHVCGHHFMFHTVNQLSTITMFYIVYQPCAHKVYQPCAHKERYKGRCPQSTLESTTLCDLLQRRIARLMLQRDGIKFIFCAMLKVAENLRIHGRRGMRGGRVSTGMEKRS